MKLNLRLGEVWGYGSMEEYFFSMPKALDLIPNIYIKKKKRRREENKNSKKWRKKRRNRRRRK
jgi:hypothetical protein